MARKKHAEEHEEHADESWLVPYADILTLLLALFIVLFASSQTDSEKMTAMEGALYSAFRGGGSGGGFSLFNGAGNFTYKQGDGVEEGSVTISIDPANAAYIQENQQLTDVKENLDKYADKNNMLEDLNTVMTQEGLLIRIKEKALFESGSAVLMDDSRRMAKPVVEILSQVSQKVIISGHTDNIPISNNEFSSNWDLSTQRALNFMKFLLSQGNLDPSRFSVVGYGEFHPAATNDTEEGRALNRRVEVLISRIHHDKNMKNIQ